MPVVPVEKPLGAFGVEMLSGTTVPSCVTVNVFPAIVIVPVRVEELVFAAMV
jgi:hypothetical protein